MKSNSCQFSQFAVALRAAAMKDISLAHAVGKMDSRASRWEALWKEATQLASLRPLTREQDERRATVARELVAYYEGRW